MVRMRLPLPRRKSRRSSRAAWACCAVGATTTMPSTAYVRSIRTATAADGYAPLSERRVPPRLGTQDAAVRLAAARQVEG